MTRCPQSSRRPRPNAGLTLLEVMVAVVILGTSMGGLVAMASRSLGIVRQAANYEMARRMLGRVDAEKPLWLEDEIQPGTTSGKFDGKEARENNWRWERVIEEVETTAESSAEENAAGGLFLLTTRVYWGETGGRGGHEETVQYLFVPYEDGKRTLKPQGL
ncbi:MAG: prepilin-type N-terminal cleavage/methylation domain-containing protein [Kiritimatiellae bacterium]|nr:prepilin-type N-terminal cleavage/methylation domain-containing protein [Kiritimatiellia bacterium]MBQ9345552.1 prepilin-type N-terminal cleavage/methylation domain-containing protein [Kiritimatiellia bacterium]